MVAVGLAFAGARSGRRELTRWGYAVLVVVSLKLLAEDLRHGELVPLAASIVLFALALIVVPRMARLRMRSGDLHN